MKHAVRKTVFLSSTLLFIIVIAGGTWVISTESGLRWLVNTIAHNIEGDLRVEQPSGNLASGVTFERVDFLNEDLDFSANKLQIHVAWSALFTKTIKITEFAAANITTIFLTSKPENHKAEKNPPALSLPIALALKRGAIRSLRIEMPSAEPQAFDHVRWQQINVDKKFTFKNLYFENDAGTLSASGEIGLSNEAGIDVISHWQLNSRNGISNSQGTLRVTGQLNNANIKLETQLPFNSILQAELKNAFTQPQWRANFQSQDIQLPSIHATLTGQLKTVHLDGAGDFSTFSLTADARLIDATLGDWHLRLDAATDAQKLVINMLDLRAKDGPQILKASATIASPISSVSKHSAISISGQWHALRWPLQGETTLLSEQGKIQAQGTLENYTAKLAGQLDIAGHLLQDLDVVANGNLKQLELTQLNAKYLNGAWEGNGVVSWFDKLKWQAKLAGEDADFSKLNDKFPSRINSNIATTGAITANGLQSHVKINSFEGTLLGHPLQAKGDVNYINNKLELSNINVTSSNTAVTASMTLDNLHSETDKSLQADWTISAKNLNQWWPDANGNVYSKGSAKGLLHSPIVNAKLSGSDLQFNDQFGAANLKANITIDMTGKHRSQMDVSGNQLQFGQTLLDKLQLSANGTPNKHQLKLSLTGPQALAFNTIADGKYNDQQWQLLMRDGNLTSNLFGKWRQSKVAKLHLDNQNLELSSYCFDSLNQVTKAEQVCATAKSNYHQWRGTAAINNLSLARFKPLYPAQISTITGLLSGNCQVSYEPHRPLFIEALLQSEGGEITYSIENGVVQNRQYENLTANITSETEHLNLLGNLHIKDAGNIAVKASLPEALTFKSPLLQQPVSAQIKINLFDLDIISLFIPEVRAEKGNWVSDFSVTGVLSSPAVAGNSGLVAQNVSLPRWGVYLQTLETHTYSAKDSPLRIEGRATANSGFVNFSGEAVQSQDNATLLSKINIEGDSFAAVNLPEAKIHISPKLQIITENENVQMEGEIRIDKADIQIFKSQASITPSADVTIIDELEKQDTTPPIKLHANIRVKFDDEIRLHGYGFDGKLKGELVIEEKPNDLTRASGELQIIDGKYEAFNQLLTITEGKLLYASSAVDNPTVAIRAIRTTSNNVVAGVLVSGEAQSPKVDLFSEPIMDDADVLAYLVLGYPIKSASTEDGAILSRAVSSLGLAGGEKLAKQVAELFGIDEVRIESNNTTQEASVVLGEYLSPKLYVQYAIGLGQTVDAMQLRYQLSDKWLIKGESAEAQGADILYTIEK